MKILFLSVCQFDEFSGGIDRVCCLLSREFIRRGHKIVYIYSNNSVQGYPAKGCEGEGQYQFPYVIWDDRNIAFFSDIIAMHRVDVVIDAAFISRYHDVAYQSKQKIPFKLITTYHGDPLCDLKEIQDRIDCLYLHHKGINLFANRLFSYLKYPLSYFLRYKSLKSRMSKIISESDYYVVLCDEYVKIVRKLIGNSNPGCVVAISNPIDLVKTKKTKFLKNNLVLFVGRLNEQKRVDRLLRIWKWVEQKINDWELVIVGDGDARRQYEDYVHLLSLRSVRFLGGVNSSEEMKRSKIITMVSSHEGFGMTLLEGMTVGTVPMAFDSYEAVHDIIDDGENGFLIKPYDEEQFANKIVELTSNPRKLEKMSENALLSVSRFRVETVVNKWEKLFNSQ